MSGDITEDKVQGSLDAEYQAKLNEAQDQIKTLSDQLKEAEAKSSKNWDVALRATSELENFKKRTEKEIANAHKYSQEKIAKDLLPVLDSFLKAMETDPIDKEGILLVHKMLVDALSTNNIKKIENLEIFDPNFHEAIATEESDEDGKILKVIQDGFVVYDRVIRPARVLVSKKITNNGDK